MIKYIYADNLSADPVLRAGMFQDRRIQFKERQKWDLDVNTKGEEIDAYDAMNPLYVICVGADGRHAGSMRFLPTVGQTMVNDHFTHLSGGGTITSPLIWECTRFCISPDVVNSGEVAAKLMLAACELGLQFGLENSVGVFDACMVRIYRRIGWSPEIIGSAGSGADEISVGLWEFSLKAKLRLCTKFKISPRDVENWFETSFTTPEILKVAVA
ncbi:MAG: acyl-homoserine-lactone synthase [Paracoccaceae bacterium]